MTNFEKAKEIFINDDACALICYAIEKMRNKKCNYSVGECDECGEWLAEEYKPQILDDVEHEYLSAVIKPFKIKIDYIIKSPCVNSKTKSCIVIYHSKKFFIALPPFKTSKMYKEMVVGKKYSLEELGL